MNTTLKTKILVIFLTLLIAIPAVGVECQKEVTQPPAPTPSELSTTLVPNVPLDIYLYAKQSSPTTIPANMINGSQDVNIESLAVWVVPAEDDFAFGIALTLTSNSEASKVYAEITLEKDGWKKLSGNTIYLVQGSGLAAESLKAAISNNDFNYYDDSESLQAVAFLPSGGTTKLAAVAVAKPSKALVNLMAKGVGIQELDLINIILKLAKLKVVAGGLYSPHQINLAEIAEVMDRGGSIYDFELGLLVLIKSGVPGFIVEPAVKKLLTSNKFTETNLGELTLYKRTLDANDRKAVPLLVRIEGNNIFVAVSGQESYAETLMGSVQVE